jgi:hypothetical protein
MSVRDSAVGKFKFACIHTEVLTCLCMHSYLCMCICKGKHNMHQAEYFRPVSNIEICVDYPRHVFSIWLLYVTLDLNLLGNRMERYCQIFIELHLLYGVSHLGYKRRCSKLVSLCNNALNLSSMYCINYV